MASVTLTAPPKPKAVSTTLAIALRIANVSVGSATAMPVPPLARLTKPPARTAMDANAPLTASAPVALVTAMCASLAASLPAERQLETSQTTASAPTTRSATPTSATATSALLTAPPFRLRASTRTDAPA